MYEANTLRFSYFCCVHLFSSTTKMPFCCTTTQTWVRNIKIGSEFKQCTVQLRRQVGCFCEAYEIFVNGQQLESHGLTYNPCSPLCCPGGEFEWEQDGHIFLIAYNSLSLTSSFGKFRLFVDGIDANTGREYSAFWRRRGYQVMLLAMIFIIIGVAWSLIFRYAIHSGRQRIYIAGYGFIISGILELVIGLIPVLKYRKPRYGDRMPIERTPNTV